MSGKGEKERETGQNQLLSSFVLMQVSANTLLYQHLCMRSHTCTRDRTHAHACTHICTHPCRCTHSCSCPRVQCTHAQRTGVSVQRSFVAQRTENVSVCVGGGGGVLAPHPYPHSSLLSRRRLRAFVKSGFSAGETGPGMTSGDFAELLEP